MTHRQTNDGKSCARQPGPLIYFYGMVAGARAGDATIIENGNKLKVRVKADQTVGYLKRLIAKVTAGVEIPFELQKHDAKKLTVLDDDKTLSDCGLVSGSVVSVPVELVEIYFVLPRGLLMYACVRLCVCVCARAYVVVSENM